LETKFSKRLKELRKEKGLTQADLAKHLNLSTYSTVSLWEKGVNRPELETVKKLALLFGVSLDYLVGESDSRDGNNKGVIVVSKEDLEILSDLNTLSPEDRLFIINTIKHLKSKN